MKKYILEAAHKLWHNLIAQQDVNAFNYTEIFLEAYGLTKRDFNVYILHLNDVYVNG